MEVMRTFMVYWERLLNNLSTDVIYLFAKYSKNVCSLIRVNKRFRDALILRKTTFLREWLSEKLGKEYQWALKPIFEMTEPKSVLDKISKCCVKVVNRDFGISVNFGGEYYWFLQRHEKFAYYLDSDPEFRDHCYKATKADHNACVYYGDDTYLYDGVIFWRSTPSWQFSWLFKKSENVHMSKSDSWTGPICKVPHGDGILNGERYRAVVTYEKIN